MADYTDIKNPWLGLESYQEGEILYGRDDDIRDLSQSVLRDKVTLLYGKSGIGKSSILNAGVIPAARRNGFEPVKIRLQHKGAASYLRQIKDAITADGHIVPDEVLKPKDEAHETIYEFFHRYRFLDQEGQPVKLLIIFDQFEEIFTLQTNEQQKKQFFAEMADFINDIMPEYLQQDESGEAKEQKEVDIAGGVNLGDLLGGLSLDLGSDVPEYVTDNDIHLVLTIREDFLSEFEYYTSAIPALKQDRYGLRPLNEEQAAQIILRPIPGLVDKAVAKLIIEKVTGRTDFELDGVPEIEVDAAVLSLYMNRLFEAKTGARITADLVEAKGGEIINNFYSDAISSISPASVEYLEDHLLNGQGRRDNITVYDAENIGHVTQAELDTLCNKKKILRQFNYAGDLRLEYVHDILCPVVKAHKDERVALRLQQEEQQRQEREKQAFLRKQREELEKIERESARQRRKFRVRLVAAITLLIIGGVTLLAWWLFTRQPFTTSYASFTVRDGWPVGVGKELGEKDKQAMPVYYELTRYGYLTKRNTRVAVMNGQGRPTRNKFQESPLVSLYETEGSDEKARDFAVLQRKTAYWLYAPDNEGNILRKTAYGMDDAELYTVQYFRSSAVSDDGSGESSQRKQLWANYVDTDGKSMAVRDNGADRVRIIANDSTGYYVGYQFYSETGTPQTNNSGAYGYRYRVGDDGRTLSKVPVDAFGDLLNEKATVYQTFDDYGRWTTMAGGKATYSNRLVVFALKQRTDTLKFGDEGELVCHSETHANGITHIFYYTLGRVSTTYYYRATPSGKQLFHSEQTLDSRRKDMVETCVYWADSAVPYRVKRQQDRPKHLVVSYFGGQSPQRVNMPFTITTAEGSYHRMAVDTVREHQLVKVTKRFFDVDGNLSRQCHYNCDVSYYNDNKEKVKRIVYKDGRRIFGYINEYDDGQITAQSVLGVDGATPVRYPGWDKYGLCYYKMKMVYNFSNTLVAVKGINEFGEESLITTAGGDIYSVSVLPSHEMSTTEGLADIYGLQVYKVQTPAADKRMRVSYIHILDMKGTWYKAGIRDGDLLVSDGRRMTIARPDVARKTYTLHRIQAKEGETGAEHYTVYFTRKEMQRYLKALK